MIGESTGHHHFDRAIQEIDAGVFSSDALENQHARAVFQHYLARWMKASVYVSDNDTTELEEEIDNYRADNEALHDEIDAMRVRIKELEELPADPPYVDYGVVIEKSAASSRRGLRR